MDWDDTVPLSIQEVWLHWRSELNQLSTKGIPRYYFPKESHIVFMELQRFCDASEVVYATIIYFSMIDSDRNLHTSMIMSKSGVAPI